MSKSTYIKAITDFITTHPDDNFDGTIVYDLYENGNGTLTYKNVKYTLLEVTPNGETNIVGNRISDGKNVHTNLNKLPLSVLEIIWEGVKQRYTPETVDTRKAVKDRTYEVAEEMKKRIEPLIERAFMTGAFDCDEAYKEAYLYPKAIMIAVFKTIADEVGIYSNEIQDEAKNIYNLL